MKEKLMYGWNKCEKCFAHYQNYHQCDGRMKRLVENYKKKNKKSK